MKLLNESATSEVAYAFALVRKSRPSNIAMMSLDFKERNTYSVFRTSQHDLECLYIDLKESLKKITNFYKLVLSNGEYNLVVYQYHLDQLVEEFNAFFSLDIEACTLIHNISFDKQSVGELYASL